MVGRQDLPTPALDPGPAEAEGSRDGCTPRARGSPCSASLKPLALPHHAQHTVCLTLQRLRQGRDVHTLRDRHRPSIEISNDHVQLWTRGSKQSGTHQPVSTAWSREAGPGHSPHQLLGLCLEGRIDTDDEGCGCAEDFQKLRRQDGHVGEAATGEGSVQGAQRAGLGGGAG